MADCAVVIANCGGCGRMLCAQFRFRYVMLKIFSVLNVPSVNEQRVHLRP